MPRKQERTTVSVNIILEWSSGKREARISDISLSGCFIECMTPINKGEVVSFKIKISEKEWIDLSGEIVTVFAGLGFGVRFISLSENDKSVIEHLILMNNGNPWSSD
jgi:hypothetical protein